MGVPVICKESMSARTRDRGQRVKRKQALVDYYGVE
jgi:hypothetical protein